MDSIKDVIRCSVKVPEFNKHLQKVGGRIGRNVVEITIKMKTIVRKPFQGPTVAPIYTLLGSFPVLTVDQETMTRVLCLMARQPAWVVQCQSYPRRRGGVVVFITVYISRSMFISKVKLATVVEGDPKAPFSVATTPRCRGGRYSFPWMLHFTLDTYLLILSVNQGGIKYHYLSLWYDSIWD